MTSDPTESTFGVNKLILGDNLEVLKTLPDGYVDLIYLDPPFFSNRNYEVIWGDSGEIRSFQDRWAGGIDHYIAWLKERVAEMHRVLKETGSIFLHCDWHANAYIRVLILDKIFGEKNFRSEITWRRNSAHNDAKQGRRALGNISDTIYYYTKSKEYTFNQLYTTYSDDYINEAYKYLDENGRRYRLDNLIGPGGASKGNPEYEVMGIKRHWRYSVEKMQVLIKEGRIIQTKKGNVPAYKRYLDEMPGVALQDLWDDIKMVQSNSKERIGYPTQKPNALLERIINMATNEGDIVLDPFMGGGTTIAVADKLNRKWLGIDQSPAAVKVTEFRLQGQTDLFTAPYAVQLHKYDYDTLRYKDAFEFESWIITQFGGVPQNKKGGDKGIDGKWSDGAPIQVKRSDNVPRDVIDKFPTAIQRYDKILFEKNKKAEKSVGYIIAFSFGKGAIGEVARLKNEENIIIKLVRVDEIVEVAVKPVIIVNINELDRDAKGVRKIEFTAHGESGAGIEFYSWDFYHDKERGFKASVIMDKEGRQVIPLKAGTHNIAVKVVDNDGLENIEVVRLRINGGVERE
jgi:DNA modification methylase